MKRILISLCIPFLVCVFASNSYADDVTIEYNGGTYTGEVSNGVPDGQGTFTWPDGTKYVGEWKEGEPWNGTFFDKEQNVTVTYADGVRKEN